jgi:tRNA(fMet)-specific endonuclease VapC
MDRRISDGSRGRLRGAESPLSVYLLDTNTCVEFLRNRNPRVVQRLQREPTRNISLCSVVLGELYYGAFHSQNPPANLALLKRFLANYSSLPFEDRAAEVYGDVRATLRRTGFPVGPHDLQIAAIALTAGLTVVTHNTSEFSRVPGLAIEDWQS